MIRKGLSLLGCWHYELQDYPKIVQVIQESPLIDLLISHVLPMRDVRKAFEMQVAGKCAKVILKPWDEDGSH
jgi:threonine dehydrogenase-like Zn-dependent dehydrogenase